MQENNLEQVKAGIQEVFGKLRLKIKNIRLSIDIKLLLLFLLILAVLLAFAGFLFYNKGLKDAELKVTKEFEAKMAQESEVKKAQELQAENSKQQEDRKAKEAAVEKLEYTLRQERFLQLLSLAGKINWNFVKPNELSTASNTYDKIKIMVSYKNTLLSDLTTIQTNRASNVGEMSRIIGIMDDEIRSAAIKYRDIIVEDITNERNLIENYTSSCSLIMAIIKQSKTEKDFSGAVMSKPENLKALNSLSDQLEGSPVLKYEILRQELNGLMDREFSRDYMDNLEKRVDADVKEKVRKEIGSTNPEFIIRYEKVFSNYGK